MKILLSLALLGSWLAGEATDVTMLLPIKNARIPAEGLLSGGQPTPEQIAQAARAGFGTVINLRTDKESGFEWERSAVEQAGMRYVQIPIAGGTGLTRENIASVDAALEEAGKHGPVILHCASGNRIGAVLALRAAWFHGMDAADALEYGRANGMTSLVSAAEEQLGKKDAQR